MKIGDVVKVQHWVGVVVDLAQTEQGKTMICVNSLKAIIRNHPPEWLTVIDGQITPASPDDLRRDIEIHYGRLVQMGSALHELSAQMEKALGGGNGQAQ